MRAKLDWLHSVNPECRHYPRGAGAEWYRDFVSSVERLAEALSAEVASTFVCETGSIQDSTHGAEISLPESLILGSGDALPGIRVSNHGRLYVITVLRRITEGTERRIEQVAENHGFTYTPEPLFGEPFDVRERINGDLLNQLYDYV